ncbi:hypothetical protein DL96DRAFT_598057 [Flagelloscypha sp. PMI_526]|nr:hypothetical protein DL96DRAFT_598057 [Flagelloscypha sp. PMI_526]
MTIDVILSRLAVQFLTRASSITHQLRSLQKRKEMKTEILAEFITAALKSISSPTFLVLDALDEFPSSSRLSLIRTLLELSPDLHLFVTSRHIPDGLLHASLQATIELKESNRTDLEDYIQSKIDNLGFQATADAKAALAGCVMKASSGIFLLAYLHISELSRCRSLFRARDVAMKLATTPRERYDHSVERLQAKDNHDRLLAIHTLMWTWAAKRPLTLEELCLAVASSTEDLRGKMVEEAVVPGRILLELCDGLVVAGRDNVEFMSQFRSTLIPMGLKSSTQRFPALAQAASAIWPRNTHREQ